MRKELAAIAYQGKEGTILNLWKTLYILQKIHGVDFWDYYESDSDFSNWCASKGYGETDPVGTARDYSQVWFKEYQDDIQKGLWKKTPYCSFIEMFDDSIYDLGNDMSQTIYLVDFEWMMKRAQKEDKKQFGKDDYRVHLTSILLQDIGKEMHFDQSPD